MQAWKWRQLAAPFEWPKWAADLASEANLSRTDNRKAQKRARATEAAREVLRVGGGGGGGERVSLIKFDRSIGRPSRQHKFTHKRLQLDAKTGAISAGLPAGQPTR